MRYARHQAVMSEANSWRICSSVIDRDGRTVPRGVSVSLATFRPTRPSCSARRIAIARMPLVALIVAVA